MARISVSESFLGMHRWKDAIDEVSFLKSEHVHDFRVDVSCDVFHDDRDIEFYVLRKSVRDIIKDKYVLVSDIHMLGNRSCETIAFEVMKELTVKYGKRKWSVSVFENTHQGASVKGGYDIVEDSVVDLDVARYDEIVKMARDIFEGRQSSYGNSVNEIDIHTIVGLIRMKLFRIYNEGLTPNTKDELLDTINYAVFALGRVLDNE